MAAIRLHGQGLQLPLHYCSGVGVPPRAAILRARRSPRRMVGAWGPQEYQRGTKAGWASIPFHDDEETALAVMHVLIHVQDAHNVRATRGLPVVVHLLSCSSPRLRASLLATLTALPASWELPSPLLTSSVSLPRPQGPLCAWSGHIQGGCRGLSPHHGKTTGCPGRDQQGPGLRHLTRAAACREAGRSPGQVGLAAQSLSHVLSQPVLPV